jgi:hypothetical protein
MNESSENQASFQAPTQMWRRIIVSTMLTLVVAMAMLSKFNFNIATFNENELTTDIVQSNNQISADSFPKLQNSLVRNHHSAPPPFSTLDPAYINFEPFQRPAISSPGNVFGPKLHNGQQTGYSLPTNKWYQNMLLISDEQTVPHDDNNVYTIPYVLSANGPVAGIKLASTRILGMTTVVQVTSIDRHSKSNKGF